MAEKDKIFYWIKLKKEFMDSDAVDFLMSQKNGANYIVLYQMLIMKTINTEGRLCSEVGEVMIPYDCEKIQRECKWFDIDTVRVAMELYSKLGLIYMNNEGVLQINNFQEMVGSETYWAKQKRLEKLKLSESVGNFPTNVQQTLISNISNLNSNNIIIEEENKEEEKETDTKHKFGEYSHILLTDKQYDKLVVDYGEERTKEAIKYLDEYIEMKGYKCKNHNLAIRKWVFDAVEEHRKKEPFIKNNYTSEQLKSFITNLDEVEV